MIGRIKVNHGVFNQICVLSNRYLLLTHKPQTKDQRHRTTNKARYYIACAMADRKARLAALAAKAGRREEPVDNNNGGNDQEVEDKSKQPTIKFRNYIPKDASLDAQPPIDDGSNKQTSKRQKTGTEQSKDTSKSALEIALAKTSRESREAAGQNVGGGWSTVTPVSTKKVNWDLKRDIQHKMDKLERRTQRAIVELLRERLEKEAAEGGGDDDSDLD